MDMVYNVLFRVIMFVFGAIFGSFLCCEVRRMHAREAGEKFPNRSICPHCKYRLKWYDNLPVVSWIFLRGKCRKCGKKIGVAEILAEVLTGAAFLALSFTVSLSADIVDNGLFSGGVLEILAFIMVIISTIWFVFVAIYDGLYGEMPNFALTFSGFCAIITVILKKWALFSSGAEFSVEMVLLPLAAAVISAAPYALISVASKERAMGSGDFLIAAATGLVIAEPFSALVSMFLANFLASVVMYPVVRKKKEKKIHLGPFIVAAFVITYVMTECGVLGL